VIRQIFFWTRSAKLNENILLTRPTNAQHIYKQYFIYRKYSYMFRYICIIIFFLGRNTPPPSSGPAPPHSRRFYIILGAPQSVGLVWTSDQLVAKTPTWTTHNIHKTNIPAPDGIRTHNLSRAATADPLLRQRGHWHRHLHLVWIINCTRCTVHT